jgi:hypothetical protein
LSLQRRGFFISLLFITIPGFALAQGGSCPSTWTSIDPNGNSVSIASYAGISSCYYASKSIGNDSNAGTSESAPWAHIPGMAGCKGNCAAVSPSAGEGFILRGGDTWSGSDVGIAWNWLASSSHWNYIGVDPNWYSGGSWARPIFNMSGAANGYVILGNSSGAGYWWIDNIEITGMNNAMNGIYAQGETNIRASQMYFHGWSHTGNSNNVGFFSQGGSGAVADHNVIDGSDSSKNTMNGVYSAWSIFKYNYVNYVVSAVLGNTDEVHDNVFQNAVTSADGDHCNEVFTFSPLSGNYQLIYNNVIAFGTACSGGVNMWFNGNGGTNAAYVGYGFGNVIYNTSGGNLINIGNHGAGNYGTYYIFNNTLDGTNGGCGGTLPSGPYWTLYEQNNHWIACGFPPLIPPVGGSLIGACTNASGSGCNDLVQSLSAANAQGYTSSETAPFSPVNSCTASTCATLQAGVNLNGNPVCATLNGVNADAYNACQKGGPGGLNYNTSNHTVINGPSHANNSRPSSGAWDIGAYQFANSPTPQPATNLKTTVAPQN